MDVDALRAAVTKQAGLVREMKKEGAPQEAIQKAVEALQVMRKDLDAVASKDDVPRWPVDKVKLDDWVLRRMIYVPAFQIHGGVGGLFDYGPAGCAVKENVLAAWRHDFVRAEGMLQIECTTLTPYAVFKTSGHVDKFEDMMVKDPKTGECYRADKLVEDAVAHALETDKEMPSAKRDELRLLGARAGGMSADELGAAIKALGIVSPSTGAELTAPFRFNLMFQTSIGPAGNAVGFLRPETAQGMFVNFRRLYDYNNQRLPMAVAQIGSAYRNEIAPRGGLLRVREFTMAEVEHFVDPLAKEHAKFAAVAGAKLPLFPRDKQVGDGKIISDMTVGDAVKAGVINNETLAYYMARVAAFLLRIGVAPAGLRFRQHLKTEMAHYATDCWDAEILMSSGWVECVGIADRSAFDLEVHTKATGVELVGRQPYAEPREETGLALKLNKQLLGKTFKGDNAAVLEALAALGEAGDAALGAFRDALAAGPAPLPLKGGKSVDITKEMASVALETRKVGERKFVPHVIEPSFGIGRILTGVFEHNFFVRSDDEQRVVMRFRPAVAPAKAVVLPLESRVPPETPAAVHAALLAAGCSASIDDSGASIGKRYARADELGTPFAITVDLQTPTDGCVTLRERDTCAQVRVPVADVVRLVRELCEETGTAPLTWADVMGRYTVVTTGDDKAAAAGAGAPVAGAGAAAPAAAAAAPAPAAAAAASLPGHTGARGAVGNVVEGSAGGVKFSRPAVPIIASAGAGKA